MMDITPEQIQNLIVQSQSGKALAEILAPLELDRLALIVYEVLDEGQETGIRLDLPYDQWSVRARQSLVDVLNREKDIFGNLDVFRKLDIDGLLQQIYEYEHRH